MVSKFFGALMRQSNKGYTIPELVISIGIAAVISLITLTYILRIGTDLYNTVRLKYYLEELFTAMDYQFYDNLALNGRCFSQHPTNPTIPQLKAEGHLDSNFGASDLFSESDVTLTYQENSVSGWTTGYAISFKLPNKNLTSSFRNNHYFVKETPASLDFYKPLNIDMTTEFALNMNSDFCEGI